jgi:hypothetical protein
MTKLRLKGPDLLKQSGELNPHRLSLKVQMAAPTVHRYVSQADRVQALDLTVFPQLVMRALDLEPDEFLAMKIGDLFEFVPVKLPNKNNDAP